MEIGNVTFEDLFDFSPEPLDRDNDCNRGMEVEREREAYRLNGDWAEHHQLHGQAKHDQGQGKVSRQLFQLLIL